MKPSTKISFLIGLAALILAAGLSVFQSTSGNSNGTYKLNVESLIPTGQDNSNVERADMSDLLGGESTGIARRAFTGNQYVFEIELNVTEEDMDTNLKVLMVDSSDNKIDAGNLQKIDAGYFLVYHSDKDLSSYSKVQVTVEIGKETKVLLEGQFNGAV